MEIVGLHWNDSSDSKSVVNHNNIYDENWLNRSTWNGLRTKMTQLKVNWDTSGCLDNEVSGNFGQIVYNASKSWVVLRLVHTIRLFRFRYLVVCSERPIILLIFILISIFIVVGADIYFIQYTYQYILLIFVLVSHI